jgi:hypothetical protein
VARAIMIHTVRLTMSDGEALEVLSATEREVARRLRVSLREPNAQVDGLRELVAVRDALRRQLTPERMEQASEGDDDPEGAQNAAEASTEPEERRRRAR